MLTSRMGIVASNECVHMAKAVLRLKIAVAATVIRQHVTGHIKPIKTQ